ncbi:aa3-type cytochrome c oxidase subunit IV [Rhizobium sp. Root1220]|uniref:aa3-type cytochrome c oxidase subunit IV n=1 Tax=Rhizobium sp. Root1220 TaxID=1736432 RepID=UPI0006FE2CEA|nr:aa3-type cytochrome c oxidase subunit IV [Rhizobium sp. Root1220]KQV66214.1 cytochrome c oxidase [Rhizobium sp. Root1220]
MAEHHTGPAEVGAQMDYKEHEHTYNMFLAAAKYGTLFLVALLFGMAAGFFAGAGLLGGLVVLLIIFIAGLVLLR